MSTHAEISSLLCPFHKDDQLNNDLLDASLDDLPGHPRVKLSNSDGLFSFICQEVWSEDLESMSDRLWWMSKQDSSNISPLHRQKVKGRQIIVTEDPRLHLVWIDSRIFLKPIPRYLTSYAFWDTFMSDRSKQDAEVKLRKAALGYLRTYFYLIQYESDLRIAQDSTLGLVPKDVTWRQFCQFSAHFHDTRSDPFQTNCLQGSKIDLADNNPIVRNHIRSYQYKTPIMLNFVITMCRTDNMATARSITTKQCKGVCQLK